MKKKDIINHTKKAVGLTCLSDGIGDMAKKLLGPHGLIEIDLIRNWEKIVGSELAEQTLPQKIDFKKDARDDGTLCLLVSSGAFALQINYQADIILQKVNTYFGYKAINKIKIMQIGNGAFEKTQAKSADIEKKILVTKDEQNYIDTIISDIQDDALKNRLESLGKHIMSAGKKEN